MNDDPLKDTPFGFCVVPEAMSFKAIGTEYTEGRGDWSAWATLVMRTRLVLVGTPVTPDSFGSVYFAFALCQLPTEEGAPAVPMTPALTLELNLN